MTVEAPLSNALTGLRLTINRSGTDPSRPTLVAIKGTVFDVSGNAAYGAKGQYHGKSPCPLRELHASWEEVDLSS